MNNVITNNRGAALVTLHRYDKNPGLERLAKRIVAVNREHGEARQRDLHRTMVRLISDVNRSLRPKIATQDEIIAALDSRVIVDCLVHKIQELRDPAGYYSEAVGA